MVEKNRKENLTNPIAINVVLVVLKKGGLKMQDRKMEEQIWGQARRWKMQDRKMEEQIWGQARRWKMRDRKMWDQKMEGRKLKSLFPKPVKSIWHNVMKNAFRLKVDLTAIGTGSKLFNCRTKVGVLARKMH